MPIRSMIEQNNIAADLTPILTAAFDQAWDTIKASETPLADAACAPSTRALLAKRIIETAQKGQQDVNRLAEDGVKYLSELR